MWTRFTERARKVMLFAQTEANNTGSDYVGTEHILLGLLSESEGVAAQVLGKLGVNLDRVRQEIESQIKTKPTQPPGGEAKLTQRAKKVLELAADEARKLKHNYIGTEHILLALVREREGLAAGVLHKLGVDFENLRKQVVELVGDGGTQQPQQSQTPALDAFGRDITQLATENKLDPVIGRQSEIERVIQILSRRTKNNPCLVGEAGVGKTAIVDGLALRIVHKEVPTPLLGKRIIALDLAAMVAGTRYRGDFEERVKRLLYEVQQSQGNIILFVDELHTMIGAGAAEGAMDASNMLKPALARGELRCIGATTVDEFRKHVERNSGLERRFQSVLVKEPTPEESLEILRGIKHRYEEFHQVIIDEKALKSAAELSHRYITHRCLPDKAIDVMDEAASRAKLKLATPSLEERELVKELERLNSGKEEAVSLHNYEKAAELRDQGLEVQKQIEEIREHKRQQQEDNKALVGEDEVAFIVSEWTGVPVVRLTEEETSKLLRMEADLHRRVIGQDEAIAAVSKAVRRARAGLKDAKRPTGSFVFVGPTGVGKTELARALAEFLFDDENALVRVDMSEYMERFAVSRLVGAPPGYVGYDEGGQLTEAVRRRPYSVVLLDEIEKAHPDVFNILLQIMEDGRLTDAQGRVVDFKNAVLIMTSNVGTRTVTEEQNMEFRAGQKDDTVSVSDAAYERMKHRVLEEFKRAFQPEFRNRIDEVVVFHSLDHHHIRQIVDLMLRRVLGELTRQGITLEVNDDVKDNLVKEGYSSEFGARPLRRALQKRIEDPLSECVLAGEFRAGDVIEAVLEETQIRFRRARELVTT